MKGSWTVLKDDGRHRPYEMWTHARNVVGAGIDVTRDQRVDCVTSLNRAINHRLRRLTEIYKLKTLPLVRRPNRVLDLLCDLGVAQPNMVRQLVIIRNAVEHEDLEPPSIADCQIFLELVWYFLRSTDGLVMEGLESFQLLPPDDDGSESYWIDISLESELQWPPMISGWLQPQLISDRAIDGWGVIRLEKKKTRAELLARLSRDRDLEDDGGRGLAPEDVYFYGTLDGSPEFQSALIRRYFD